MFENRKGAMRKITVVLTILIMSSVWLNVAEASIARGGGGARPAVGNRSAGAHAANVNRGNVNRANVNRGNLNRGNVNAGNVNRSNINRANINQVNINRNVDAHGWGNHYFADDNHWGWGSFAGAATGAAVGAAVANRNDVEAAAPAPGTVVASLPAGCSAAGNTDQALYNCGGVQYQAGFQGSDLMYQAVGQP